MRGTGWVYWLAVIVSPERYVYIHENPVWSYRLYPFVPSPSRNEQLRKKAESTAARASEDFSWASVYACGTDQWHCRRPLRQECHPSTYVYIGVIHRERWYCKNTRPGRITVCPRGPPTKDVSPDSPTQSVRSPARQIISLRFRHLNEWKMNLE